MSGKKFYVSFLVGITVLGLLFCMSPGFAGYAEAAAKSAVASTNGVNVRSGPGTGFQKIGMINKGSSYEVIEQKNGWAKLKISSKIQGWVTEAYLKFTAESTANQLVNSETSSKSGSDTGKAAESKTVKTIVVKTDNVNLRTGPGTKFAKVGKANKGQQFTVAKESGGWYYVNIGQGKFGWIIAQYVSVSSKPASPPVSSETVDLANSTVIIKSSIVNIRSGAGTGFGIVGKVKAGDRLAVLKKYGQWYLVQLTGGKQGWVAGWLAELETTDTMSRDGTDQSNPPVTQPTTETTPPVTPPVTPPTTETTTPPTPTTPETGMSPGSGEGTGIPVPAAKIQSIELTGNFAADSNSTEEQLVIKSEGDIQFNVSLLNQPDRLVIDLQNSDVNNIKDFIPSSALVSNVRVAQFSLSPMVVRIVLDLNKAVSYTPKVDDSAKTLTLTMSEPSIKGKTVVIDAGHGGYDPGAGGVTGLNEKDFNLDLALKLRDKVTALGATVIVTRADDTFVSLSGRADVANQVYADVFVSIHANSSNSTSIRGTSTYFYAPSTVPALYSEREQRQKLAAKVQGRLISALGTRNIGTLQANFAVLRQTQMPSILVESAFLSNADDEALLKDNQFREKEAQAIADGLCDYFAT